LWAGTHTITIVGGDANAADYIDDISFYGDTVTLPAAQSIGTTYNTMGLVDRITSYSGTSGTGISGHHRPAKAQGASPIPCENRLSFFTTVRS